jgi:hypothetical protein
MPYLSTSVLDRPTFGLQHLRKISTIVSFWSGGAAGDAPHHASIHGTPVH